MTIVLENSKSVTDDRYKMNNEIIRHRLCFQDCKLKIESLYKKLVIAKEERIILSDKCALYVSERNVLVGDNMRFNVSIDKLHNSINMIESHEYMTHHLHHSSSKRPSLESEFPNQLSLL